ncbi:MAG: nicotinate-nucleotide adenylyltransferase [Gammaproteobacteria bacterium]
MHNNPLSQDGHSDFGEYTIEKTWSNEKLPVQQSSAVGLLGGTFDPVHLGHIHLALSVYHALHLKVVQLIPCAQPPLKSPPVASIADRLTMLSAAIANQPELQLNLCEVNREGVSYTIDTVKLIREQMGPSVSLNFIVGIEQFSQFHLWKAWQDILNYVHVVVATRANFEYVGNPTLDKWLHNHQIQDFHLLHQKPAGYIYFLPLDPVAISASQIRHLLSTKNEAAAKVLLPQAVWKVIQENGYYVKK